MFSFFSRLRLPLTDTTTQPQLDEGDDTSSINRSLNLPWPVTESATYTPTRRGPASIHSAQGVSGISISNPIPRTTPNSLTGFGYEEYAGSSGYSGSIRRVPLGSAPTPAAAGASASTSPGLWYEQEIQKPKSRRLYPPLTPEPGAQLDGQTQIQNAYAPPAVVRLDSGAFTAAAGEDEEDEPANDEGTPPPKYAYTYTANPRASSYAVPYPYPSPNPGYTTPTASQSSTQNNHHIRNLTPNANAYRPSQSSPELDGYEESSSDFYASPFDADLGGEDGAHEVQVPVAVPARSTTSTTSSSSTAGAEANAAANASHAMTKSRWGLKLQLQQLQAQGSSSMPSLPHGAPQPHLYPATEAQRYSSATSSASSSILEFPQPPSFEYELPSGSMDTDVYKHAYNFPLAKQLSPIAEQDYFSPSPQSDAEARSLKFGRSAIGLGGNNGSRNGSSARASPAVESILGSLAGVRSGEDDRTSIKSRTGSISSVRTPNGNGMSLSRAASISMTASGSAGSADGMQKAIINPNPGMSSEIPRPSPFINRHLNRTASQTSSKSDSQGNPNASNQTPTHSQAGTPILTSQTPRGISGEGVFQAQQNRAIAHLSTTSSLSRSATSASPSASQTPTTAGGKETIQTPTSSATTGAATGTMYTPSSAFPQSPNSAGASSSGSDDAPTITILPPPGAVVVNTPPVPTGHASGYGGASTLPKIPSIPSMEPLELRFSMLGSVASRGDRNSRVSVGSATKKGRDGVDRMPVIDGSVEGYYEDEEEEDGSEEEDDGDEDENDDDEEEEDDDDEYDEEEYERESLHADSFVTAGGSNNGEEDKKDPEGGMELATLGKHTGGSVRDVSSAGSLRSSRVLSAARSNGGSMRSEARTAAQNGGGRTTPGSNTGESFIHRRWERDAALGFGLAATTGANGLPLSSSPTTLRTRSPTNSRRLFRWSKSRFSSTLTPAFWTFWLGFVCPMLWLVGGWLFTNAGEMPPKYTVWEWYFWNRRWSARRWFRTFGGRMSGVLGCFKHRKGVRESDDSGLAAGVTFADQQQQQQQRRTTKQGKRRSNSQSTKARAGKVYPALPRWVAEKQSTDDGRMRLNDYKRSLRGISFGYPFISRPPTSQDSCASRPRPSSSLFVRIVSSPNRGLDQLYGVKLKEVRGRPESGRRMFDPWIQRCRYAFCYGMLLLAVGLCSASVYLIIASTRKLGL